MKYGFQPASSPVGASVVEVTETGYVQGIAYLQSNNTLGSYSQVEEDVMWTGETFPTEHEAVAAALTFMSAKLLERELSKRFPTL